MRMMPCIGQALWCYARRRGTLDVDPSTAGGLLRRAASWPVLLTASAATTTETSNEDKHQCRDSTHFLFRLRIRRTRTGQRQAVPGELGAEQVGQRRLGWIVQPYAQPGKREARTERGQAVQVGDARQVLPPRHPRSRHAALE